MKILRWVLNLIGKFYLEKGISTPLKLVPDSYTPKLCELPNSLLVRNGAITA